MTARQENRVIHRIVTGVFTVSVLCVVGLLWYLSSYNRPYRRPRNGVASSPKQPTDRFKSPPPSEMFANRGANIVFRPGMGYQLSPLRKPQGFPRYFASMSSIVGEYIISVRQVADFERNRTLYENYPADRQFPLSHIQFSIQIMAASQRPIDRIKEFAPHIKVITDNGVSQSSTEASEIVKFDQGMARLLLLPAPPKDARYYKSVEGTFTIMEKGIEKQIPFSLPNIALPVENHLLGLAAAAILPAQEKAIPSDSEGKGMIQGSAASALDKEYPPFAPETGPLKLPNRLLLISNVAHRVPLACSSPQGEMPLICTLTTHPAEDSAVTFTCRIEAPHSNAKPLEWQVESWENDPVILTFAGRHFFPNLSGTIGVRLLLFSHPPSEIFPTNSPIPPAKESLSGSLVVQAQVGGSPLRFGKAKIEIVSQQQGAGQSGVAAVDLDERGIGAVNNLPPGVYQVTLTELQPYHNNLTPQRDGMTALAHRFRLIQPKILDQIQSKVVITPGGVQHLQPWRVTEGKIASN